MSGNTKDHQQKAPLQTISTNHGLSSEDPLLTPLEDYGSAAKSDDSKSASVEDSDKGPKIKRQIRVCQIILYVVVLFVATTVTIWTALGIYLFFIVRDMRDIGNNNKNQSLQLNVYFMVFDGVLIFISVLQFIELFYVLLTEIRSLPEEFTEGRLRKLQNSVFQRWRSSRFMRFAIAHSVILVIVVVTDIAVASDVWVDIPLFGLVAVNVSNGALLYFKKVLLEDIYNHVVPQKEEPDPKYTYKWFLRIFIISCIIVTAFCISCYSYYFDRDYKDLGKGKVQPTQLDNIYILELFRIIFGCLEVICLIILAVQAWTYGQNIGQPNLPPKFCAVMACLVVITIHFILGVISLGLDIKFNPSDILTDVTLVALVATNLCSAISILPLWKIMQDFYKQG